jgi:hypothetical protein
LLLDKIEELRTGRIASERAQIAKSAVKNKKGVEGQSRMLADKAHHSDKKQARRSSMDE